MSHGTPERCPPRDVVTGHSWQRIDCQFLKQGVSLYWAPHWESIGPEARDQLAGLDPIRFSRLGILSYPIERHLRLLVVEADTIHLVSWPSQLAGKVRIRDQADVAWLISLFSSPDTCYRFPELGFMEISPTDADFRNPGEVSREDFRALGLPERRIVPEEGCFRVFRPVVRIDASRWRVSSVAILEESFGHTGEYFVNVLWEQQLSSPQDFVQLPLVL